MFVIHCYFVSAQSGRIICLSCLVFSWYIACTLLIPFLALCVLAFRWHNLYWLLVIKPHVFLAFYMYTIDPIHVDFVYLRYCIGCLRARPDVWNLIGELGITVARDIVLREEEPSSTLQYPFQSWLTPTGFHGFTKIPSWSQMLNTLMLALWIDWTWTIQTLCALLNPDWG